jgi:hypothetical protein
MKVLKNIRQDLWLVYFIKRKVLTMKKHLPHVARYTSIRTIIALAAKMKWKLHEMDVKKTFLNGVIEEEVYIEKPQGFEVEDKKDSCLQVEERSEWVEARS